jgi:hypothetical protein
MTSSLGDDDNALQLLETGASNLGSQDQHYLLCVVCPSHEKHTALVAPRRVSTSKVKSELYIENTSMPTLSALKLNRQQ